MLFQEQAHDGSGLITSHVWHAEQFWPLFAAHPQGWQWDSQYPLQIQSWVIPASYTRCRPHHDATGLLHLPVARPTRQRATWWHDCQPRPTLLHEGANPHSLPPCHISLWPSLVQIVYSLTGPGISSFQPHFHTLAGTWPLPQLCLSAHSKVLQGIQQSICKVYGHAQHLFLQFCHCYGILFVPMDQETLLYFATFLADAKGLQYGTIIRYLYRVHALHINMGLPDPLKGTLRLNKCLSAIHIQSNPESHKLALTYDLLVLALPLHQFLAQQVLWAALTMAHFSLFQTGEFTVDKEQFNPTHHLCIQHVTPSLTTQLELRYITIHLNFSKTDPFG